MEPKTRPKRRRSLLPWPVAGEHGRILAIVEVIRRSERMVPLAVKIAVPLVVISITAAAWLGSTLIAATRASYARTYADQAEGIAQLVASGYVGNSTDQQAFIVFLTDIWSSVPSVRHIRLFRQDGGTPIVWASTDPADINRYRPGPAELAPITTGVGTKRELMSQGELMLETIEPVQVGGRRVIGSVGVFTSLKERDRAVAALERKALLVTALGVVLELIALWMVFFWLVLRRMARLSRAAAQVAAGDLNVHLPEGQIARGGDELFKVAREFDHMAGAVAGRTRQQAALTKLGQRALEGLELTTLMDEAVRHVLQGLDVEEVGILRLTPQGDSLLLVAAAGSLDGVVGTTIAPAGIGSLAGYTLAQGEPVIVEDARTETRFTVHPLLLAHGVLSSISVVVPGYDKPYGTFVAHTTRPRRFTADEVQFVQAMAHTLGWTVRQKYAQEQLGEARVLEMIAKDEPLPNIFNTLAEMVESQRPGAVCAILLVKNGSLFHAAGRRLPEGYIQAIDGTPVDPGGGRSDEATALAYGLRAGWAVPIAAGGGPALGVFVTYYREPRTPTPDDLRLAGTASQLAAIAIEQRSFTEKLTHQAQHDALTGLPNRVLFEDRLQQALALAKRDGTEVVGLLIADLNNFKRINDTLGHAMGDKLLKFVAERLAGRVRDSDTLARMGGDEFAVVLTSLKDPRDAATIAQNLLDVMNSAFDVEGHRLFLSGSMGISLYPQDGQEAAVLIRSADAAMYRAKVQGANTFQFFAPEMHAEALERLELDNSLRRALDNQEFRLDYQPQLDLRSSELVGVEALLRWHHPTRGLVNPLKFIPLAEENGLILPIGGWVLREACRQNVAWQRAGYAPIRMAVNVSALQFARPDFVQTVSQTLEESGLAPRWLELEVTESLLMRDIDAVRLRLAELRQVGVAISIDDFGTGYSSLSYLQQLPIDSLKIDRAFVRELKAAMDTASPAATLVRTILSLAHNLGMQVVAEGVETTEQRDFLRTAGCELGQGYLFAKPMPPEAMPARMTKPAGGKNQAA